MPPTFWSDGLRIGHASLDEVHRLLVERLNALGQAARGDTQRHIVLALFDDWLDEFARHARIEEQLMERLTLPAGITHRQDHMAEHSEFLHRAMDIRNQLARGGSPEQSIEAITIELVSFDFIQRDFELMGLLLREDIRLEE